jgi:hypothetical protein
VTSNSNSFAINNDNETNSSVMDSMTRHNADNLNALTNSSSQFGSFVSKRLSENFVIPQHLMACKTPMEIAAVWAEFYHTAMQDYSTQTSEVTSMIQGAVGDAVDATQEITDKTVMKKGDKAA